MESEQINLLANVLQNVADILRKLDKPGGMARKLQILASLQVTGFIHLKISSGISFHQYSRRSTFWVNLTVCNRNYYILLLLRYCSYHRIAIRNYMVVKRYRNRWVS